MGNANTGSRAQLTNVTGEPTPQEPTPCEGLVRDRQTREVPPNYAKTAVSTRSKDEREMGKSKKGKQVPIQTHKRQHCQVKVKQKGLLAVTPSQNIWPWVEIQYPAHPNPHQNRLKWVVHLPKNGTIGFDPQPSEFTCNPYSSEGRAAPPFFLGRNPEVADRGAANTASSGSTSTVASSGWDQLIQNTV